MGFKDTPTKNLTEHLNNRISYLLSRIEIHSGTELGLILASKKDALQEILGLLESGHFNY